MDLELISTELWPLNSVILAAFCTIWYNQLLLQFLKDSIYTLETCWEHNEDMHMAFLI